MGISGGQSVGGDRRFAAGIDGKRDRRFNAEMSGTIAGGAHRWPAAIEADG